MVCKVVLSFMSKDQILEYGNLNDSFSIVPCNGALYVSEFTIQNWDFLQCLVVQIAINLIQD